MNRGYIRRNITGFSVLLFIIFYLLILFFKPSFIFDEDKNIRDFGLGSTKKTVLPLWLISLVLGIASYLLVLFYITYPKLR